MLGSKLLFNVKKLIKRFLSISKLMTGSRSSLFPFSVKMIFG